MLYGKYFCSRVVFFEMERSKRKYKPPARFNDFQTDFKTPESNPEVLTINITSQPHDHQRNSTNESTSG